MAGLLFTGAEDDLFKELDESAIGLRGKISVVSNTLLGTINLENHVKDFTLLDTDPLAVPSDIRGIISSGVADQNIRKPKMLGSDSLRGRN